MLTIVTMVMTKCKHPVAFDGTCGWGGWNSYILSTEVEQTFHQELDLQDFLDRCTQGRFWSIAEGLGSFDFNFPKSVGVRWDGSEGF